MRRLVAATAVLPLAVTAACSSAGHPGAKVRSTPPTRSYTAHAAADRTLTDWPTYHRTGSRSGVAAAAIHLPLHHDWSRRLDGAVYGEPLVVNRLLIAATEGDTVYGLNPATGAVKWKRHLGTPESRSDIDSDSGTRGCGDITPLGITGTPAYDARTGSVFVVAETLGGHHTLWALNAKTGARRWHRNVDVLRHRDRRAEQQRSALLVVHGRIITSYGGLSGDCGNYVGYLTSTATNGTGSTTHYAVPTAREAGMWAPPGPVVGRNGNVYVASGNGAEESGRWDKSDSVTELNPVTMHRLGVFAPSTWTQDNIDDADLGSSAPVPVNGRIVIAGKSGTVYLLRTGLGGVGAQVRKTGSGQCVAFGGAAHLGRTVVLPCAGGIRALVVGKRSLHWTWRASGIHGSPVIAGSRVVVTDQGSSSLKVLSLATGRVLASVAVGPQSTSRGHVFSSEVVDGDEVFVPSMTGITALRGS